MKRCLIADQSEVVRKIARYYLEKVPCEVLEAETADSALEVCRDKTDDAIILDGRLPGKPTLEFLSTLRLAGPQRRPLVIYATTENDPADISKAFAAGVHTYMMKPFDRAAFMETLSSAGFAV
jgi:two-component system chemotaxis response regulator CheY